MVPIHLVSFPPVFLTGVLLVAGVAAGAVDEGVAGVADGAAAAPGSEAGVGAGAGLLPQPLQNRPVTPQATSRVRFFNTVECPVRSVGLSENPERLPRILEAQCKLSETF